MNNNNDLVAEIKSIELEDPTAIVLAGMLTENTGTHMLDSGGAYGRNWERNQGLSVESFIQAPKASIDKYGGVTIDLFHFLKDRIEFMPEIQAEFDEWANNDKNKDDGWYSLMIEWCDDHKIINGAYNVRGFNSYNDDCALSQTIQGDFFEYDNDTYLILQIHGGCDVRGGYTAPKIFSVYNEPYTIFDWNSYTIQSIGREGSTVSIDVRHGEVIDMEGNYIGSPYSCDADRDPLIEWLDFDKLEWDKDKGTFKAPDGNGWIEVIAPESY